MYCKRNAKTFSRERFRIKHIEFTQHSFLTGDMSIGVVFSKELVELTSLIPKISGRSEMLAMLMDAFLLTEKFEIIEPNEICG